jgi:hypothetical protein
METGAAACAGLVAGIAAVPAGKVARDRESEPGSAHPVGVTGMEVLEWLEGADGCL